MTQEQKRIVQLETALRWIVKTLDVRIHRISLFYEIQDRARMALDTKTETKTENRTGKRNGKRS
jgi:hypothetical protein